MKPDPEQLKPQLNLPIPNKIAAFRRTMTIFVHYSEWIPSYLKIETHLGKLQNFLYLVLLKLVNELKRDIANSVITSVNPYILIEDRRFRLCMTCRVKSIRVNRGVLNIVKI